MKKINYLKSTLVFALSFLLFQLSYGQENNSELQELVGTWKLDMSPENKTDSNFAMMTIESVSNNTVVGEFYREGVPIREGRTNTQTGQIYVALVSGDNSGDYNSSFYLENGKLFGSTHSLGRHFLAVWVGEKL